MVVQLDDILVILADIQHVIRCIVQEVKSSDTTAKPEPIQVCKHCHICTSSDESSVELLAITDKGSASMVDGLLESGKSFYATEHFYISITMPSYLAHSFAISVLMLAL